MRTQPFKSHPCIGAKSAYSGRMASHCPGIRADRLSDQLRPDQFRCDMSRKLSKPSRRSLVIVVVVVGYHAPSDGFGEPFRTFRSLEKTQSICTLYRIIGQGSPSMA